MACCALFESAAAQGDYSKLVVFGDSLSDTGNLAIFNFPPPYFQNRISDGPVIADLIAVEIGSTAEAARHLLGRSDGFNYAVAGGNIRGDERTDLTAQVTAYLQRVNNQADPDALYLVFAGGNDIRELRSLNSSSQADSESEQIVATLKVQLERLKSAGARLFLVPNVANIGRLPETLERELAQPGITQRAENYTRNYNARLKVMLAQFGASPRLSLGAFDFFQTVEFIIENAATFGFTNVREGCFDPDEKEIALECALFGFNQRVFFDGLHPSSASNRLVADQMIMSLPETSLNKVIVLPFLPLLLFDQPTTP